jgi:hypothetical protein
MAFCTNNDNQSLFSKLHILAVVTPWQVVAKGKDTEVSEISGLAYLEALVIDNHGVYYEC